MQCFKSGTFISLVHHCVFTWFYCHCFKLQCKNYVLAVYKDTLLVFNLDDSSRVDSPESYDDAITAGPVLEDADGVVQSQA